MPAAGVRAVARQFGDWAKKKKRARPSSCGLPEIVDTGGVAHSEATNAVQQRGKGSSCEKTASFRPLPKTCASGDYLNSKSKCVPRTLVTSERPCATGEGALRNQFRVDKDVGHARQTKSQNGDIESNQTQGFFRVLRIDRERIRLKKRYGGAASIHGIATLSGADHILYLMELQSPRKLALPSS